MTTTDTILHNNPSARQAELRPRPLEARQSVHCQEITGRKSLFAERLGGRGEHLRDAERLGQIAGDAEVHRFDRARLGGEAGDDDDRQVGLVALGLANDRRGRPCPASSGRRSADRRDTSACRSSAERPSGATSTSYSASASVFDSRSRMLASSSTTRTRGRAVAGAGRGGPRARRAVPRAAARALAVEPRVDVALAEPPLAADAHRGNLARP